MKLVEVMDCVGRVAKNGQNATQHYAYAMASDVYDAVRGELAKRLIMTTPRVLDVQFVDRKSNSGGNLTICTLKGELVFTDAETGEVETVPMFGQGSDSLDKAIYKAETGAMKNALVHKFLIPTGDDPENEPKQSKAPAPAGVEALKQRAKSAAPSAPAAVTQHTNGATATHDRSLVYPFGSSKGYAIGALKPDGTYIVDAKSLDFWIARCTEELADASKSKWHDAARKRIFALESEKAYRLSEAHAADNAGAEEPPMPSDEDRPF